MVTVVPFPTTSHRCLEDTWARTEKFLNVTDLIPVCSICTCSGMLRLVMGMVQVVAGAIFALYKILMGLPHKQNFTFLQARVGAGHVLHGYANMVRGAVAITPGINLLLLFYDGFVGRWNYPDEKMEHGVYPLNQWQIGIP